MRWWVVARGSPKAAMLSCGHRNLWRAMVNTHKEHERKMPQKRKRSSDDDDSGEHWSYDDFVMPLLCVCGTRVFIGAGIVTPDKSTCCLIIAAGCLAHAQFRARGATRHHAGNLTL